MEKIVAEVKKDDKEMIGEARISTADIIVAWLIKVNLHHIIVQVLIWFIQTVYDGEPLHEKQQVALVSALSFRSVVAKVNEGPADCYLAWNDGLRYALQTSCTIRTTA